MILTHLWLCGAWVWRWLTFAQWRAMPHIGRKLAMLKAAKLSAALVCAGTVGVTLPHLLVPPELVSVSPWTGRRVVATPEPGGGAVLLVGLAGLGLARCVRRKKGK
jgi:MYXO-CTERM domain-containing protein